MKIFRLLLAAAVIIVAIYLFNSGARDMQEGDKMVRAGEKTMREAHY